MSRSWREAERRATASLAGGEPGPLGCKAEEQGRCPHPLTSASSMPRNTLPWTNSWPHRASRPVTCARRSSHELDVAWSWRLNLQDRLSEDEADLSPDDYPDVATIREHWRRDEADIRAWLDTLSKEQLAAHVDRA